MERAKRLTLLALGGVVDPELGLDVVSLGLVYGIQTTPDALRVDMTLTTRGCPMGEVIVGMAREALDGIAGQRRVDLRLVWEPAWEPGMMSPGAKADLLR